MNTRISSGPSDTFRLEGALDIYSAEHLRGALTDCLAANDHVVLDLGGVEEIDTTGIQLLLSAGATAAAHGKTVEFRAVPPASASCCHRLGLPSPAQPEPFPAP